MKSKTIKVNICPVCKSSEIILWLGGELGIQYNCKKCGYIGSLIIEKDFEKSNK